MAGELFLFQSTTISASSSPVDNLPVSITGIKSQIKVYTNYVHLRKKNAWRADKSGFIQFNSYTNDKMCYHNFYILPTKPMTYIYF